MSIAITNSTFPVHAMRNESLRMQIEWLLPTVEDLWSRVQERAAPLIARRIAIAGIKDGDGASTLAVAFAHFLWRRLGKRVLLIETDLRKPGLERMGLAPEGCLGLLGVLDGDCEVHEAIYTSDPLGIAVMPAGRAAASPATMMTETNLGVICLKLNPHFDYVVYDCPALHGAPEARIPIASSDSVVTVLRAGTATPELSSHWLAMIGHYGGTIGAVCLNGVKSPLPGWLRKWF